MRAATRRNAPRREVADRVLMMRSLIFSIELSYIDSKSRRGAVLAAAENDARAGKQKVRPR